MNRTRWFAELVLLALLALSASPARDPGPGRTSTVQADRPRAPGGPDLVLPHQTPLASEPVDEARREAASKSSQERSGDPTGALLIAAALVAAVALILAVVYPW